jgi:hypothetical protein
MVTDPTARGVTRPLPSTEARAGVLLDHVTTRPVSGLPVESFGVAVNCNVAPTRTPATAGLTVTLATGTGGGGGGGVQGETTTLQTVALPTSA